MCLKLFRRLRRNWCRVQRGLQADQENLVGFFTGNPTKETHRPTAERLLRAFKGINLSIIDLHHQHIRHVTPSSEFQNRILFLLRFSPAIYADLTLLPPIPPKPNQIARKSSIDSRKQKIYVRVDTMHKAQLITELLNQHLARSAMNKQLAKYLNH